MNIALILSGGVGLRLGENIPKQYIKICGKPIINYCVETFSKRTDIDLFVFVMAQEWRQHFIENFSSLQQPYLFAEPGETRQHSIYNGLKECEAYGAKTNDIVIIHDAARPLVNQELIDRCIEGCKIHEGILPVIRVKDTIYLSNNGQTITTLMDRNKLYAGQAPESFLFGKYLNIHNSMNYDEISRITGSTEIAYKFGLDIQLVSGDDMNFKITTREDLKSFESIIKSRKQ